VDSLCRELDVAVDVDLARFADADLLDDRVSVLDLQDVAG
jgi:hypothetical protein